MCLMMGGAFPLRLLMEKVGVVGGQTFGEPIVQSCHALGL